MKKPIIVLSVIIITIVVAVSAFMIYSDRPIEREDIKNKYRLYKDDFEKANDYIIKEIADDSEIFVVVSWDYENKSLTHLYCNGEKYFPEEIIQTAFENISQAFSGYDFSYIDITSERITYYGQGEVMFVYSRKGGAPKYFYSPNDGVSFNAYTLWDGWYFLKVSAL